MKKRFLFLACALLSACASTPGPKVDLERVRPWTAELSRSQPLPAPFLAEFSAGLRSLVYLAVNHENDLRSPSLALTRELIRKSQFGVVILEGFPRSAGLSPESMRLWAQADGRDGFFRGGERALAIQEALLRGKIFVGAEPEEELLKSSVLAAGFALEDLFGFYVARQVPQWRRSGVLEEKKFAGAYADYRAGMGERLGLPKSAMGTPDAFRDWYQAKMEKAFRVRDINAELVAPYGDGDFFFQRISAVVGRVRDQHMVRVIEEMVQRYGQVVVIFGASHFSTQQPALESWLGKPKRISDGLANPG